jgi:predicted ribosome quality control (RQC) complex YloA/Tae2 family protein
MDSTELISALEDALKRSQLENKSLAEEAELLRSSLSNETKKHSLLVSTFDNRVDEQVRKAEAYKEAAASMASAVEELERKLAAARVENEAQGRQLTEWRRKLKDSEERLIYCSNAWLRHP